MAQAADTETRIKVFISYSRADKAFASDLVLGLAACGFAPYIDRQDIAAGEDWEKRLAGLISEADSIVYVISPDSLTSENCAQEFQQALALQKRILPVVWRPVDDAAAPPEMKRLNYIFFAGEGRTFAAGLSDLAAALRTDIDWIREHTRLSELARRWSARGRAGELLLRGDDIDTATAWMAAKPITAPPVTDDQSDFIKASSDARVEADRRARRARTGLLAAVSSAAIIFAGLAGFGFWQWQIASQGEATIKAQYGALETATDQIKSQSLRLNADLGLRVAPSTSYIDVAGGWFPIAANFSGALARVERRGGDDKIYQVSSGLLIDGALINTKLAGEAFLLVPLLQTANFEGGSEKYMPSEGDAVDFSDLNLGLIPQMRMSEPLPPGADVFVSVPAVATGEIAASELVWRTPDQLAAETPFEIWRLASPPPEGARPIVEADIDCSDPFGLVAVDHPNQGVGKWIASFGVHAGTSMKAGEQPVTLYVSKLVNRDDPRLIRYDHATDLGATGAPVFDLETGKIFAIHIASAGDPGRPGRRIGLGYSLPMALTGARSQSDPAEGRLPLMCGVR
jgi:TIR domain